MKNTLIGLGLATAVGYIAGAVNTKRINQKTLVAAEERTTKAVSMTKIVMDDCMWIVNNFANEDCGEEEFEAGMLRFKTNTDFIQLFVQD